MKKIIDGKLYDTATATAVFNWRLAQPSDFRFEETTLYRSPKGKYFLAGMGGPDSRWAQPDGNAAFRSGEGLTLISERDARRLVEDHGTLDQFVTAFGEPEAG